MACKRKDSKMESQECVGSRRSGVRRRSFDFGEIKRAADGGASIDCCCNYNAILAQSQMKLFRTELRWHPNVSLQCNMKFSFKLSFITFGIVVKLSAGTVC